MKISRAGDSLWTIAAFDPRKPVDPDWATKSPAPVLRSGVEEHIFNNSPYEHHHMTDQMEWTPESHGAYNSQADDYSDPSSPYYDPWSDPRYDGGEIILPGDPDPQRLPNMPDSEEAAVGRHQRALELARAGSLEGSRGSYVEYHPTSSVNHYYTWNPRYPEDDKPWNLVSHHWALREPVQTRHATFDQAVAQGRINRRFIDRRVG